MILLQCKYLYADNKYFYSKTIKISCSTENMERKTWQISTLVKALKNNAFSFIRGCKAQVDALKVSDVQTAFMTAA